MKVILADEIPSREQVGETAEAARIVKMWDDGFTQLAGSRAIDFLRDNASPSRECGERQGLSDEQILALNVGEVFFSETPSKYPEAGHGTQYHAGAPGVVKFARAAIALAASAPTQQECPHGVDDGACKQCYGEAVRGSCPDGSVCEIGCFGECEKRAAASTPTLGGGAAPWQGCKHRVCYKNGACWTAGKCLEPTEPEPWPTEIDAQIKACALMILGICATRPQDEWPKRIEGRIRYMLSRLQPQAAEPKGMAEACRKLVELRHSEDTCDYEIVAAIDAIERVLSAKGE